VERDVCPARLIPAIISLLISQLQLLAFSPLLSSFWSLE
jgi:hypothetical protein